MIQNLSIIKEIGTKGDIMEKATDVHEFISRQRLAVASNPECGTSHYNLAVGLLGLQQDEEAEMELHKAIECSPSLAEAYVQLGGLCLKRGDLDGCLDFNRRAVKARPGFSEGYGNIGFVHLQRGEVDEAIKALKRATAFNFRFVQAFSTLASAYLMKGQIDEAIENGLKAIELQPEFAVAHNNLAVAYLEKGETDLAARHAATARELGYEVSPELIREIETAR
jgi:tetratricopeptide (TPR) repeat protein